MEKNKMKDSLVDKIAIVLLVYTFGVLMAMLLNLFRTLNWIKISHLERFPRFKQKLIIVSNHPSLLIETSFIPALFWKQFLLHPFKFTVWMTPDKTNFTDKWYWRWLKPRAISVKRGDNKAMRRAYLKMREVLNSGGILHLLPEGTRTNNAKKFFESPKCQKKLGVLKDGVASLVLKTGASIFYIWVDGAEKAMPVSPKKLYTFPKIWKGVAFKIGKTTEFKGKNKEEVAQQIVIDLLELADEPR